MDSINKINPEKLVVCPACKCWQFVKQIPSSIDEQRKGLYKFECGNKPEFWRYRCHTWLIHRDLIDIDTLRYKKGFTSRYASNLKSYYG